MNTRRETARSVFFRLGVTALALPGLVGCGKGTDDRGGSESWVGTWGTAIQKPLPPEVETALKFDPAMGHTLSSAGLANQTMRMVVHTSVGGEKVRIRFSNLYGTSPLQIGAASVALRQTGAPTSPAVTPGSVKSLLFSGAKSFTLQAGAEITSDPLAMPVKGDQDLVVSVFAPAPTGPATWHRVSMSTSYLASGDLTADEGGAAYKPVTTPDLSCWFWLAAIEVAGSEARHSVVMLGDSIFDGRRSTLDANHRYPDYLARRLNAGVDKLGVLNMGLAGGRILYDTPCCGGSALARLQHDVLDQVNVSHVVLFEGINDVSYPQMGDDVTRNPLLPVTAEQVIDGIKQIVAAAHARNLKVVVTTILPFKGAVLFTPEGEARRQQVNAFIRTGAMFDGMTDLDAVMRDPMQPDTLLPSYANADHVHLSDSGYELLANAVDLAMFKQ